MKTPPFPGERMYTQAELEQSLLKIASLRRCLDQETQLRLDRESDCLAYYDGQRRLETEIERLKAEVARLSEALQDISDEVGICDHYPNCRHVSCDASAMQAEIARRALAGEVDHDVDV